MKDFFFDTANVDDLKRVWNDLKNDVSSDLVRGITTNPAIWNRAGKNTLQEWLDTLPKLAEILFDITRDKFSEIHVQFPNSRGSVEDIEKFYELLYGLELPCRVAIKGPP